MFCTKLQRFSYFSTWIKLCANIFLVSYTSPSEVWMIFGFANLTIFQNWNESHRRGGKGDNDDGEGGDYGDCDVEDKGNGDGDSDKAASRRAKRAQHGYVGLGSCCC